MESTQRTYETTFIVNATLEDAQIDIVIEKVRDLITKNGGTIQSTEKWGRKRLSYPVQKKNNGYYALFEYKGPGDLVAKLERHYQLDEQILRYLTIQLDKKALKAHALAAAKVAAEQAAQPQEPPKPV